MNTGPRSDGRGRRGFGHSQDRRQVVAVEAELIRDAAVRVLAGDTLVSIVDEWNSRGVRTTTGGPWHINALSSLLIQPRLTPDILDQGTHDRLVALRKGRRKPLNPTNGSPRRYLLTGFLRCWRCGSRLNGTARFGATARPCYRCPSRGAGGCSGAIVQADFAERVAHDAIVERVDSSEFATWVRAEDTRLAHEEQVLVGLFVDAVTGREAPGKDDGGPFWVDGKIDGRAWRALKTRLEDRAHGQAAALGSRTLLTLQKELCGSGAAVAERWGDMSLEDRRSVVEAVVEHFVVWPAGRPRNTFRAERLEPVWRTAELSRPCRGR